MARMLQALKNLEARSAWPVARPSLLSHLAENTPAPEPLAPAPGPPLPAAKDPEPPTEIGMLAVVALPPEPSMHAAPSAIVVVPPAVFQSPVVGSVVVNTMLSPARENITASPAEAIPAPAATRPPTKSERDVRRTLGEPHRRQPLSDLATRLRQDAHKSGSRTLLLAGIGEQSSTHETALHLASLLAEEGGRVLLVDGDLARRNLSSDLDYLQEPGLSNVCSDSTAASDLIQPTALQGLKFLPVGTQRFAELDAAGNALARSIGRLGAEYDLVLIDGGHTGDPGLPTLARLCDATYVIVQLGAVEATQAQKALRDLRAQGARVLGCIATGGDA